MYNKEKVINTLNSTISRNDYIDSRVKEAVAELDKIKTKASLTRLQLELDNIEVDDAVEITTDLNERIWSVIRNMQNINM